MSALAKLDTRKRLLVDLWKILSMMVQIFRHGLQLISRALDFRLMRLQNCKSENQKLFDALLV
jgi:hypothetical protein